MAVALGLLVKIKNAQDSCCYVDNLLVKVLKQDVFVFFFLFTSC